MFYVVQGCLINTISFSDNFKYIGLCELNFQTKWWNTSKYGLQFIQYHYSSSYFIFGWTRIFSARNVENKNEIAGKWGRIGKGITLKTDILVGNRHKVSKCVPWPLTCVTRCVNGLSFCFQSPPLSFLSGFSGVGVVVWASL